LVCNRFRREGRHLTRSKLREAPRQFSLHTWEGYTFTASLGEVKVLVLPLAKAAVSRPDSWAKAIQLSLREEVHAYRVEAISAGSTRSIMLGYFFYVSGGFREVDELMFGSLAAAKQSPLLPYISAAEAQMLLQSTQPVTPHLSVRDISNKVILDVIIDVAGQLRSASILSGDLVLGNAARAQSLPGATGHISRTAALWMSKPQ